MKQPYQFNFAFEKRVSLAFQNRSEGFFCFVCTTIIKAKHSFLDLQRHNIHVCSNRCMQFLPLKHTNVGFHIKKEGKFRLFCFEVCFNFVQNSLFQEWNFLRKNKLFYFFLPDDRDFDVLEKTYLFSRSKSGRSGS